MLTRLRWLPTLRVQSGREEFEDGRRTFSLTGAGVAALLPAAGGAAAKDQSLGDSGTAARQAPDLSAALQRFRATIPSHFDREYVNNAVVPFFLGSIFAGERPILPMIDLPLTKQDAIPWDFWGMLYEDWKPTPSDGVTVFLEGLENRGDNNLRNASISPGSRPIFTLRNIRPRLSTFLTSFSIRNLPTSLSCAITSTIIGISTGTSISA